jgi:hypothetical protein
VGLKTPEELFNYPTEQWAGFNWSWRYFDSTPTPLQNNAKLSPFRGISNMLSRNSNYSCGFPNPLMNTAFTLYPSLSSDRFNTIIFTWTIHPIPTADFANLAQYSLKHCYIVLRYRSRFQFPEFIDAINIHLTLVLSFLIVFIHAVERLRWCEQQQE